MGVEQRQEDADPGQLRVAHLELGRRRGGLDQADLAVGRCDHDAGPGGRDPGWVPEEACAGAGGQQAGPAQPAVAAADQGESQASGDERQTRRVHGRNGRAQQRQQVLRTDRRVVGGRAGTSCHAVILEEPRRVSDRIRDAGQFLGDCPQPVLQVFVVRLCAGRDHLRVATLLAEAVRPVVLAAFDIGVGGGSQRG